VIALVGLPGRGKSFLARKLQAFLMWIGVDCKIFNVGKYRRQAAAELAFEKASSGAHSDRERAGSCSADFFDASNTEAAELRERVADIALQEMLRWLDGEDDGKETLRRRVSGLSAVDHEGRVKHERIAIFDATNSTVKRRQWILEECTSPEKRPGKPTGVVFVESLCDDEELLSENFRFKVVNSPDFKGMDEEEAIADLRARVQKYEDQYEAVDDDSQSYIKVFNLSSKVLVNHCYGRMAKIIVPAIMAWNIGSRPVFMCRPGKTHGSVQTDKDDYVSYVNEADPTLLDMSAHTRKTVMKGDNLGMDGMDFSLALRDFVKNENNEFFLRRSSISNSRNTGTSLTGLAHWDSPFPTTVFTSTMPRAVQTCQWAKEFDCVEQLSNLNPLDKGDFMGLELDQIQEIDPDWYARLEEDPFNTR
jgi:predicted kinase